MHGVGLALGVHGKGPGVAAQPFGHGGHILRQQVTQALAASDLVDHLHHGLAIAKAQIDAIGILQGQQPLLKGFHGQGDGDPGADRIQRVGVAGLVSARDPHQVAHAAGGA